VLQSLVLGYRWGLTQEMQDIFAATGTLHIFAISGSHVVIIAGLIVFVLRALRVSRVYWFLFLCPLLSAYTLATGSEASAVRACVMSLAFFVAPLLGRRADVLSGLALSAVLILAFAPPQLLTVGFICSFAVVIGLIVLCPLFDKAVGGLWQSDPWRLQPESRRTQAGRWVARAALSLLAMSLAAWVASTPLTACFFGRFSATSLPSNLMVVPISSLVILSGCLSLVFGPCIRVVAEIFNHASLGLVAVMTKWTAWMCHAPFGDMRIEPPPVWSVWLWYALIAAWAIHAHAKRMDTQAMG
jgi:ComEC/Rec2-related protein